MHVMGITQKEMAPEFKPERDMETMACREKKETHLGMYEVTLVCQESEERQDE
jgi:hypothetical protein